MTECEHHVVRLPLNLLMHQVTHWIESLLKGLSNLHIYCVKLFTQGQFLAGAVPEVHLCSTEQDIAGH